MTPVVKSLFTDLAMEITNDAMQIHGGYGYTKDQGIEQLYRDNRITPIYEGTNSVQAAEAEGSDHSQTELAGGPGNYRASL